MNKINFMRTINKALKQNTEFFLSFLSSFFNNNMQIKCDIEIKYVPVVAVQSVFTENANRFSYKRPQLLLARLCNHYAGYCIQCLSWKYQHENLISSISKLSWKYKHENQFNIKTILKVPTWESNQFNFKTDYCLFWSLAQIKGLALRKTWFTLTHSTLWFWIESTTNITLNIPWYSFTYS